MINKHLKQSAFTLIELLVVIAIIGILSSVVLASLSGAREGAKVTRTVSDYKQIEKAMTMWMQNTGRTEWPQPSDVGGSGSAIALSAMAANTSLDEYLNVIPEPPFGSSYTFWNKGANGACSTNGVILRIPDPGSDNVSAGEEMNRIVEDDSDLNCGKFRIVNVGASNMRFYYVLSEDQSF